MTAIAFQGVEGGQEKLDQKGFDQLSVLEDLEPKLQQVWILSLYEQYRNPHQ